MLALPPPRLLAVDADGTLLDGRRSIPAAHRELLRWAAQRGLRVCLVTGRPLCTARWPWQELGFEGPMVCFNGVWVGTPDGEILAHEPLPAPRVRQALAVLQAYPGMRNAYPTPDSWLVDAFNDSTRDWPQRYQVEIQASPERFADWQEASSKLMFVADPLVISRCLQPLQEALADDFHVVVSEPDRLEIHQPFATKAWGLQRLAAYYGVEQAAVWAVGDACNDIEMLQWAGCGFAMGHAPPEVLQAADRQLPPIREAGLAALRPLLEEALA